MIRLGVGLALKNEDPEEMARAYVDAGYSADSYLALLKAVDRPALAVHLDPVNWINSPVRYYDNAALVRDCFRKLGPWIVSCHAKDIVLRETLTVHLDEVAPTQGALDYGVYLQELARLPGDMPLLLEHLPQERFLPLEGPSSTQRLRPKFPYTGPQQTIGHISQELTMKDKLTAKQISQYQEEGFLLLEGFLGAEELEQWRSITDDAVWQRLQQNGPATNQADPGSYYAQVFTQCQRLADTHKGMAGLMLDEQLGRMAGLLAGVAGIRIWHDQALIKPPYGNPTGFHFDNPYWSFYSRAAISIWVALDDATLANGCLWYLPGTHKEAEFELAEIGENLGDMFKAYPAWRSIEAIPTPCQAGSAVFHNGLVAHAAGANMTPRPRRAMTCAYMPDGSTFNGQRNILPEGYYRTLQVGDALDNDAINPLIWKA